MIHVIATIEVAAGRRSEFLEAFQANVPLVLAEEGCLEYVPTIDMEKHLAAQPEPRPDSVTVVEKWSSLETLQAHLVAPHMVAFRERVHGIALGTKLQILQPAGA